MRIVAFIVACGFAAHAAAQVKHPNLILNAGEIDEVRAKMRDQPWNRIVEKMKREVEAQDEKQNFRLSAAALYAITGEEKYAAVAHSALAEKIEQWKQPQTQYIWNIGGEEAVIYDLIWPYLKPGAREEIESAMKLGARHAIEYANSKRQTWNMFWIMHAQVGMLGYVTGDKELIEWGLNDPGGGSFESAGRKRYGGFYQVMEGCTKDGAWAEPNAYAYYIVLPYIVALAECARHNGNDLWKWKSPKGNGIADMFDRALDRTYPAESTAVGESFRMASFGDAGTQSRGDFWLANAPAATTGGHRWRFDLAGLFEIASRRTNGDYLWVAMRDPNRDINIRPLGYVGLLYGDKVRVELQCPPAPSSVMTNLGMAMLRADQSSNYWSGKGLAVFFMTGAEVGHEHQDLHEIMLHANGRLVYADIDSYQYEGDAKIGWTQRPIAHNTLTVDGASTSVGSNPAGECDQPVVVRSAIRPDVQFVCSSAMPWQRKSANRGNAPVTQQSWPMNVRQTRALFVTKDYVADFLCAASDRAHIYDWAMHGFGRIVAGEGFAATDELSPYRWIKDVKRRETSDAWFVDWSQDDGSGVRMHMLASPATRIFIGEGPYSHEDLEAGMTRRPPGFQGRIPLVIARREMKRTVFAAVHEPYPAGHSPKIRSIALEAENQIKIIGDGWIDRCKVDFETADNNFDYTRTPIAR